LVTNGHIESLRKANSSNSTYLFHKTAYSQYDIADHTLSCGRKSDALKLWLGLKRHGIKGFTEIANNALSNAKHAVEFIKTKPEMFEMINK